VDDLFRRFSDVMAQALGSSWAFIAAMLSVVLWGIAGPMIGFSPQWQLIANTGTTIITFLMVFIIQNTQNRDSRAIHIKLNELLAALEQPSDELVGVESRPEHEQRQIAHSPFPENGPVSPQEGS